MTGTAKGGRSIGHAQTSLRPLERVDDLAVSETRFLHGRDSPSRLSTSQRTGFAGGLPLHKFDAALQAQLEGYLVELGILQKGQTLNAQETPPSADATEQQPAFEY